MPETQDHFSVQFRNTLILTLTAHTKNSVFNNFVFAHLLLRNHTSFSRRLYYEMVHGSITFPSFSRNTNDEEKMVSITLITL